MHHWRTEHKWTRLGRRWSNPLSEKGISEWRRTFTCWWYQDRWVRWWWTSLIRILGWNQKMKAKKVMLNSFTIFNFIDLFFYCMVCKKTSFLIWYVVKWCDATPTNAFLLDKIYTPLSIRYNYAYFVFDTSLEKTFKISSKYIIVSR